MGCVDKPPDKYSTLKQPENKCIPSPVKKPEGKKTPSEPQEVLKGNWLEGKRQKNLSQSY